MKRYCLGLLLFLFACPGTWGQKMAEDYFNEAIYAGGVMNDSLAALRGYTYLVEHFPHSKFCPDAYHSIGTFYEGKGEDRLAIPAYRAAFFDQYGRLPSKDTMLSEFGAKAQALKKLIDLYEKAGNYDSALYFLYVQDTAVRIFVGCVVQPEFFAQQKLTRYADLYIKTGRLREAEKILLSGYMFKWRNYGGEYDGVVSGKLKEIFIKYENPDTLNMLIEEAINHCFLDTVYSRSDTRQDTVIYCCFNFLGAKVAHFYRGLPGSWQDAGYDYSQEMAGSSEIEKIIAILKQSELCNMIRHL